MCKFYLRRHRNGRCKLIDKIVKCQSMLHKCECCSLLKEEIINENKSQYEKWIDKYSITKYVSRANDGKDKL